MDKGLREQFSKLTIEEIIKSYNKYGYCYVCNDGLISEVIPYRAKE